ncbi:Fe-S-containing protein [Candidatus Magnetomonas plexicatena]|uniref:Fe-S-containing protein n=1 Tax=Candidatus Magnetomonas plexicatena TaxID=2552947 RepID=UPI001C757ED9|nr:DUF2318 domain-containing protein [Nitrospirales bacterium LBB_01]
MTLFGCKEKQKFLLATLTNGVLEINEGYIKEKTPLFYAYNDNGKTIKFFIVRVNGKVRSYFDVCNSCKIKNLGYRTYEAGIECRACSITIPYEELETGIGSCYPFHLKGEEKDGKYTISKEEILRLKEYL